MKTLDARKLISLKNILFATDFSTASAAALPYAIEIARRYGAKVYGVHVSKPRVYPLAPAATWVTLAEADEQLATEGKKRLENSLAGVPNEVIFQEGNVWRVLSAIIEKNEIDMVVIGTRGLSGVDRFLLGSVAEVIFRHAPCPVLTVGPEVSVDPERVADMPEILYATDFSQASLAAAPYAISLAQEHEARLALLHVIEAPKAGDLVHPEELVNASVSRLRHLVPEDAEFWCEPAYSVELGEPAEKILDVAKRRKAGLIVLGVRCPKGSLSATTHLARATAYKVVSHAKCPVLTVRG